MLEDCCSEFIPNVGSTYILSAFLKKSQSVNKDKQNHSTNTRPHCSSPSMDQMDSDEHAQQSSRKKPPQNSSRSPFFLDSANSFILPLASTQSHRNPRRPPLARVVVVVDSVVVVVDSVVVAASTKFAPETPWT